MNQNIVANQIYKKDTIPMVVSYNFLNATMLFFFMSLFNLMTIGQITNLVLTIPQMIVILYQIYRSNIKKAIVYHLFFLMTCISAVNAVGFSDDTYSIVIYSYARLKLIGPVSFSYAIWIILLVMSWKNSSLFKTDTLFNKTFKYFLFFFVSANLLAVVGFVLIGGYSWDMYISYNVYAFMTIIAMACIIQNDSLGLKITFYKFSIPLLIGTTVAAVVAYFFGGVTTSYGAYEDISLQPDMLYFGALLILALLHNKNQRLLCIFALLLYVLLNLTYTSGKNLMFFAIAVVILFAVAIYSKQYKFYDLNFSRKVKIFLLFFTIMFVAGVLPVFTIEGSLLSQKIDDVFSIFSGDLSTIGRSPYIRIASILNIIDNNITRPVQLLLGQGYGGYFTDSIGLFYFIDIGNGAWTDDVIKTGRFTSAHDTFSVVPLLNGFVGLYLVVKISWLYIRRIHINFLSFAVIPWILFTMYYNTQYAFMGIFFLYASELNLTK